MSQVLKNLINLLKLEQIENFTFRGECEDLGFRSLFGGQVLGQSVAAAGKTVEHGLLHSLHGYFLRAGNVTDPIHYEVDPIRNGKSFSTRRVVAFQKEKAIFNLSASFQIPEKGLEYQINMPDVPPPEEVESDLERTRSFKDQIPERVREKFTADKPIETRTIDPINYFAPKKREPVKYVWFKASGELPDDTLLHQCLLSYASDFGLLGMILYPHGVTFFQKGVQMCSLDHSMWFYREIKMDDWLLYAMDSPSSYGGRGLSRGNVFNRSGLLLASITQEGLCRVRE